MALSANCGEQDPEGPALSRQQLIDSDSCQGCHPQHYAEWKASMHGYAADDPVFAAMNQRGQRDSGGALGSFCVNCHAPMAVREATTTDGLNLDDVPQAHKGVTCYFCHNASAVNGTHNNALDLADDRTMRGPLRRPQATAAHESAYSPLMDGAREESAQACGGCHDIVNPHGAFVERTFDEWNGTLFSRPPSG